MAVKRGDALSLAEGLESLLQDPAFDPSALDYSTRRRLSEAARKLSLATEAPGDTVHRIAHTVHYHPDTHTLSPCLPSAVTHTPERSSVI